MNSEDTDWKYGNEKRDRQRKVDRERERQSDRWRNSYV